MPRVPYFRGNIASAAMTGVAPVAPSAANTQAQAAGRMFSGLFKGADPEKAAQTDYYKAQADHARAEAFDTRSKTNQAMRAGSAIASLPGDVHVAPNDDGTPGGADHVSEAMRGAYTRAVANGADPKKAAESLANYLATQGASPDDIMSKLVYATTGKGLSSLGGNEAIGVAAQQGLNDQFQGHDTENKVREELTKKYGFDTQAATSTSNNLRDNATSRANNGADNSTARRGQDMTNSREVSKANLDRDALSNTVTDTTLTPAVAAQGAHGGWFGVPQTYDTPAVPAHKIETKTTTSGVRSRSASAAMGGGAPAGGAADPFPGVADGQIVNQGGRRYRREGGKMVPVA